jgi:hypothetical protein
VLLALGAVLAACFGVLAIYQVSPGAPPQFTSRQYEIGLASTKVFVDSPVSQISNVGADTAEIGSANDIRGLMTRAQLLASLMSTGPLKARISAQAGVPLEMLTVIAPTGFGTAGGESAGAPDRRMSVLDLSVDEKLPVIIMNARAADAATAKRVAGAAVDAIRHHVDTSAQAAGVAASKRLVVAPITPLESEVIVVGPRKLYGVAVFCVVFALWAVAIVMIPRLAEYWRSLAQAEAAAPPRATQQPPA